MIPASELAATHKAAFSTDRPWSLDEIAALLDSPGVWRIGDAACFLLARVAGDEAEVLTLATHPDHRRRGLAGRALSQFATDARARGATQAFLEVAADNGAACALYRGAGFAQAGLRPRYYRRPGGPAVDALILRKALTQG